MKHPIASTVYRALKQPKFLRAIRLSRMEAAVLYSELKDIGHSQLPASMTVWLRQGRCTFTGDGVEVLVTWPEVIQILREQK